VTVNSTIGLVKALYKVTQDEKIRERVSEIQSGVLKSFKIPDGRPTGGTCKECLIINDLQKVVHQNKVK
jgi:hypothetical protein